MYNTSHALLTPTLFTCPIMNLTSTPRSQIKRLRAAAQPTLVRLAVGPASHISSERVKKKHSTVSTRASPQGCGLFNHRR
jgi:hypothetical protein